MVLIDRFLFIVFFISLISCAKPSNGIAGVVRVRALSIRNGLESQISLDYPLADPKKVFRSKYFKSKNKFAQKAGFDLKKFMNKMAVAHFNPVNNNLFLLFYNTATARRCKRDYLIQRVKITKSFYDEQNKKYKETSEYLVEIMKTKKRSLKRADEHYKSYSLNKASKRGVLLSCEIGCGVIPNVVTGQRWPYDRGSLYEVIQGYSHFPGYYDKINFDFSTKYSLSFEFSRNGIHNIKWPYFLK